MDATESVSRWYVLWRKLGNTDFETANCVTTPGYSTLDDLPKMIGIRRGIDPAEITILRYLPMPDDSDLAFMDKFDWQDESYLKVLTCVAHPYLRWTSKNPFTRNLHFNEDIFSECGCKFKDMRVIVSLSKPDK